MSHSQDAAYRRRTVEVETVYPTDLLLRWLTSKLRSWRYKRGPTRVWVTTGGKGDFDLVTRWALIRAAFSRKDVWL